MNISFDDNGLEELYTTGSSKERKYKKLSLDVVKQYVRTVNSIKAATRV
jgi:proteic killer suppression protein